MPTCEHHKQMAERLVQVAIACSAPSVAEALMALALDHMRQATAVSEPAATSRQQPIRHDQSVDYGD
jgi:hypothetical protein